MRRLAVLVALAIVACTTTRIVHIPPEATATPDAGPPKVVPKPTGDDDDDDTVEADAGDDGATTPEGPTPTKKTTAVMAINSVNRTLERAQFGLDHADAGDTFRIEAHEGGDPKCPDETSPSPKRTLIISGVKKAAPGTKLTKADGVNASFLDFVSDQLQGPFTKATAVTVTIVAITGTTAIEIEVDATFPEGTAKGRVYAMYCESLND